MNKEALVPILPNKMSDELIQTCNRILKVLLRQMLSQLCEHTNNEKDNHEEN